MLRSFTDLHSIDVQQSWLFSGWAHLLLYMYGLVYIYCIFPDAYAAHAICANARPYHGRSRLLNRAHNMLDSPSSV